MTQDAPDPRDVRNAGQPWSANEIARLGALGGGNTPMRLIVRELGRAEAEIRAKADEAGIKLDSGIYNRQNLHEPE